MNEDMHWLEEAEEFAERTTRFVRLAFWILAVVVMVGVVDVLYSGPSFEGDPSDPPVFVPADPGSRTGQRDAAGGGEAGQDDDGEGASDAGHPGRR